MATDSISETDDRAARWAIRLDGDPLSDVEQRELDAWLGGDDRRAGALLRAEAALAYLDRGRALARADGDFASDEQPSAPQLGRRGFLAASVAGLAAALIGYSALDNGPDTIATALGEVRRVPLADGSIASVNTASRVAFAMQDTRRDVKLEEGEAWFQVAHDPAAPFTVEAGSVRVRAVGTAFSVRRVPGGAQVHVTEGRVETWLAGSEALRQRVPAGASAFIDEASATPPRVVADEGGAERQLAWRSGQLIFSGDTLADAAAEFNRYNKVKVRIADPQLAGERFVGRFRTNEPDAFAHAAATINGARIRTGNDEIVLLGQ